MEENLYVMKNGNKFEMATLDSKTTNPLKS